MASLPIRTTDRRRSTSACQAGSRSSESRSRNTVGVGARGASGGAAAHCGPGEGGSAATGGGSGADGTGAAGDSTGAAGARAAGGGTTAGSAGTVDDGAAAAGAGPTIDWPDSRPIGCVRAGSEATGVGAALAPAWVEVSPALFGGSRPSTEAAPGAGSPSFRYRYPAPRTATRPDVTSTPTHRGPLE